MNQEEKPWSREKTSSILLQNAGDLRNNLTEAEEVLWSFLRNRKLDGIKFRRQQPIEGFILNFYCNQSKLGIEIDGSIHSLREVAEYDAQRTTFLN